MEYTLLYSVDRNLLKPGLKLSYADLRKPMRNIQTLRKFFFLDVVDWV